MAKGQPSGAAPPVAPLTKVITPAPPAFVAQAETVLGGVAAWFNGSLYVHLWVFPVVLVAGFVLAKLF